MYGNKYKDQSMFDLNQVCTDTTTVVMGRNKTFQKVLFAGVVFASLFAAKMLLATPWTDEDGNPNPDCTGSCHETGIPNPPTKPEPLQSKPAKDTEKDAVYQCGCGYVVILTGGVSKKAAQQACERRISEEKRKSCTWPNGVYPGDKG